MTTDQDIAITPRCPRCKSIMFKPAGSTLYWHADANHPACSITNIPESPEFTMSAREAEAQRAADDALAR
ncbi:hypothetical protein [Ktedonospora formicarum]|uniref:Uncharacterized protein n=1 Tax=Ktedonospora formicarum TaxID=2778364 RepID=A0A8J3MSY5_9CHLR|nr:hypothetical protein [Ktedonospora formicarum]GHO45326.1 hypothetical protein KSX_34890 [Ktedonospora formicarum]